MHAALRLLLSAVLIFGIWGTSLAQDAAQNLSQYSSPDKTFKCLLPAGWAVYESPGHSREVTKVDGVHTYRGGFEDRVSLTVQYYPEGNMLHRDMERYIRVHSAPLPGFEGLEGRSYGPAVQIDLKGAKGMTWERTLYEYESHVYNQKLQRYVTPLHPRKAQYSERFIALPVRGGFAAFVLKARPDEIKNYQDLFSKVVDSFELIGTGR